MSENRSHSLAESTWEDLIAHDGVFVVDDRQRIVYWSPSAHRILDYRPEDVTGKPCYELVGGRDSRNDRFCRLDCPVMVNARRGRPMPNYDILCSLPDGRERWINVSVVFPKGNRSSPKVLHLFRDVGRRRRAEEFARKTAAVLRPLLHEVRNVASDDGDTALTPLPKLSNRELQVLRLLASGMTTAQIAEDLGIRPVTARNHITRLLSKLNVNSRLQAVVFASQRRII